MSFDIDIAIPQYSDEQQGDGLIRVQWRNGDPRLKTPGRFFVPEDRLGDLVPGDPWKPVTEVFESGDEVEGYAAETLRLAILCARQQPFQRDDDGRKIWLTSWPRGAERVSMQVDVLCYMQGFEELSEPVVWASSTIKTSFAIIGRGGKSQGPGILHRLREEVVKPASKAAGKSLDTYCFWATVTTERTDKGAVAYTETPGKKVTRPVLKLPPHPELDTIRKLWVGTALIRDTLVPMREEYEAWRQEQRTNAPAEPPAAPGRNAPQPVSDDDLAAPADDELF